MTIKSSLLLLVSFMLFNSYAYADQRTNNKAVDVKQPCHAYLNYKAIKLRSSEIVDFCQQFKGKALLLVNTASKCGFTPQFKGLEILHKKYGSKLAIVGFPSNDFSQEHDDSGKVAEVCYVNYGVTFTMLEKSIVKGENANLLFKMLGEATGREPDWNFSKYLVSPNGQTVQFFASKVKPQNENLIKSIESLL